MYFRILGPIQRPRTIAVGRAIRELPRLRRIYGPARWRKRAGDAIQMADGTTRLAEIHWYKATGIGRHEHKIKRFLD